MRAEKIDDFSMVLVHPSEPDYPKCSQMGKSFYMPTIALREIEPQGK